VARREADSVAINTLTRAVILERVKEIEPPLSAWELAADPDPCPADQVIRLVSSEVLCPWIPVVYSW
jgi:hypothetical protein